MLFLFFLVPFPMLSITATITAKPLPFPAYSCPCSRPITFSLPTHSSAALLHDLFNASFAGPESHGPHLPVYPILFPLPPLLPHLASTAFSSSHDLSAGHLSYQVLIPIQPKQSCQMVLEDTALGISWPCDCGMVETWHIVCHTHPKLTSQVNDLVMV